MFLNQKQPVASCLVRTNTKVFASSSIDETQHTDFDLEEIEVASSLYSETRAFMDKTLNTSFPYALAQKDSHCLSGRGSNLL